MSSDILKRSEKRVKISKDKERDVVKTIKVGVKCGNNGITTYSAIEGAKDRNRHNMLSVINLEKAYLSLDVNLDTINRKELDRVLFDAYTNEATVSRIMMVVGLSVSEAKLVIDSLRYKLAKRDDQDVARFEFPGSRHELSYTAEELLSMFLKAMKTQVEQKLKRRCCDNIFECCVAIPIHFTSNQINSIKAAANLEGLGEVSTLEETSAAVIEYATTCFDEGPRIVFFIDVGYMAIQVCIASFQNGEINMLCEVCDKNLGSRCFDDRLLRFLKDKYAKVWKSCRTITQTLLLWNFKAASQILKERLSLSTRASVTFQHQQKTVECSITQQEFESITRETLMKYDSIIDEAIKNSGITIDDIHSVVRIGSGCIPSLIDKLKVKFGKTPDVRADAVAKGCFLSICNPELKVIRQQAKGLTEPKIVSGGEPEQLPKIPNEETDLASGEEVAMVDGEGELTDSKTEIGGVPEQLPSKMPYEEIDGSGGECKIFGEDKEIPCNVKFLQCETYVDEGGVVGTGFMMMGSTQIPASILNWPENFRSTFEDTVQICSGHGNLLTLVCIPDEANDRVITEKILPYKEFFMNEWRTLERKEGKSATLQKWWEHIETFFRGFFRGVIDGILYLHAKLPKNETMVEFKLYAALDGTSRILPSIAPGSKKNQVLLIQKMIGDMIMLPVNLLPSGQVTTVDVPLDLGSFINRGFYSGCKKDVSEIQENIFLYEGYFWTVDEKIEFLKSINRCLRSSGLFADQVDKGGRVLQAGTGPFRTTLVLMLSSLNMVAISRNGRIVGRSI